jgi:hypothetical protein
MALAPRAIAQVERGELDLLIAMPDGSPAQVIGDVRSDGNGFYQSFNTDRYGHSAIQRLVFGIYSVELEVPGFAAQKRHVEVDSPVPIHLSMHLSLAPVQQSITVSTAPLLDPNEAASNAIINRKQLGEKISAQPGRSLLDLINDQPGWLFEANGVLHPRESEYDTQVLINGVPRTENLSPSFSAGVPTTIVDSVQVRTAGIPAEYGRSVGGVIDLTTGETIHNGWHGQLSWSAGSFNNQAVDAMAGYGTRKQQTVVTAEAFRTSRYLDPPAIANFTNRATAATGRVDEHLDVSPADKLQLDGSFELLHAMVPNEKPQQLAGQRQDRSGRQYSGTASWQHTYSENLMLTVAGSGLDTSARLNSNLQATPVAVWQDRGFRQTWAHVDAAGRHKNNDWKIGADTIVRSVYEHLDYAITNPGYFSPGTQLVFDFGQQHWDTEPAGFVEDSLHLANWNVSAGLRYDLYSALLHRTAWSPRLAVSRYFSPAHLLLHVAYDRVFQVPAIENLLLASSPQLDAVSDFVQRLPVQPARANYYEIGATEQIGSRMRVRANVYWRRFRNFGDDDVLLNTGVSFPISYASARIHGEELSLLVPDWRHFLFQLTYSNQNGTAEGPITGGLFLGDEGASELALTGQFPITQDQRNTLRGHLRWQASRFVWFGVHAQYNSGLPIELDKNGDVEQLRAEYGDATVEAVNFDRGRIRPWSSVDLSAGVSLFRRGERQVSFELQAANVSDRLNVVNFANLFSGTAIGPPRTFNGRLSVAF